jgi:Transcription factor WhiB
VNADGLSALLAVAARGPDLAGALCVDAREVFDRAADVRNTGAVAEAAWACARCPVMVTCRAWVTGLPHSQRPRGVVGGLIITDRPGKSSGLRGAPLPLGVTTVSQLVR